MSKIATFLACMLVPALLVGFDGRRDAPKRILRISAISQSADATRLAVLLHEIDDATFEPVRTAVAVYGRDGSELFKSSAARAEAFRVAVSPDGRLVAFPAKDGIVQVWSVDKKELLHELKIPSGELRDVCFSPSGRLVAMAINEPLRPSGGELVVNHLETGMTLTLADGRFSKAVFFDEDVVLGAHLIVAKKGNRSELAAFDWKKKHKLSSIELKPLFGVHVKDNAIIVVSMPGDVVVLRDPARLRKHGEIAHDARGVPSASALCRHTNTILVGVNNQIRILRLHKDLATIEREETREFDSAVRSIVCETDGKSALVAVTRKTTIVRIGFEGEKDQVVDLRLNFP